MFTNLIKKQMRVINSSWQDIDVFKSSMKPCIGEYIYCTKTGSYYKVINVIHSLNVKKDVDILLVVENVNGEK